MSCDLYSKINQTSFAACWSIVDNQLANMWGYTVRHQLVGLAAIAITLLPYLSATGEQGDSKSPEMEIPEVPKSTDPLVDEPLEPMEQCQMINQVQSVVIQILSAHYEYGKGIHRLHGVVDNLQKDIVVLKSSLDELDKRQSAIEDKSIDNATLLSNAFDPFGANKFLNSLLDAKGDDTKKRHFLKSGVYSIQRTMGNLTDTVQQQADKLALLDKKYKRLRRTMKHAASTVEKWKKNEVKPAAVAAAKSKQDENMLEHFMIKQKEINGNLIKRMMFLEEKWKRMSLQQDSPRYQLSHNGT